MLVGVFGVSGVGKTTFAKTFIKQTPVCFHHLSASELIHDYNGSISLESLNRQSIRNNQDLLSQSLKRYREANPNHKLIIDLHTIIETSQGLVKVGKEALDSLHVDVPVFLNASPPHLFKRRESDISKSRFPKTVEDLADLQQKAFKEFKLAFPSETYLFYINHPTDTETSISKLIGQMDF